MATRKARGASCTQIKSYDLKPKRQYSKVLALHADNSVLLSSTTDDPLSTDRSKAWTPPDMAQTYTIPNTTAITKNYYELNSDKI